MIKSFTISFISIFTFFSSFFILPTFASTIINVEAGNDSVCINGTCTTAEKSSSLVAKSNEEEKEASEEKEESEVEKTVEGEVKAAKDTVNDQKKKVEKKIQDEKDKVDVKKKELEDKKKELEEKAKSFNIFSFIEEKIKSFLGSFFN